MGWPRAPDEIFKQEVQRLKKESGEYHVSVLEVAKQNYMRMHVRSCEIGFLDVHMNSCHLFMYFNDFPHVIPQADLLQDNEKVFEGMFEMMAAVEFFRMVELAKLSRKAARKRTVRTNVGTLGILVPPCSEHGSVHMCVCALVVFCAP